ncbi:MAG: MotA/TolQ/ExbB proton channel family protein [Candidatus Marinimicrobia bacterium]|jgi:biopolymer transport protein ExbB|nr:MotA/TolQ/ExbB proton channel family protein [Candidatus Neomarinimicrobiota bacterium]MBT3632946.1 MotA/TolQ/ExbB proton channel family protein [Candidatus Neomarinimicrobiota bacterium]MBT3682056.1 MotA/TolQ/ExbB proton channel family protein [Candidatus Neomarinimicrobiota bacterium]MBT3758915.1 MotA/TolQ/ExbB proton channel family protein [Candidatus Neomarinimicrobiota bacterium]MBT3895186.1 MotA/TolQ/ExbB proton channel family protein [Candidatus Neomarinimicrobiota bacterium]
MVQLFLDGGGFMWPILGALIIGLLFVLERLVHLIGGLSSGDEFAIEVTNLIETQGFDVAKSHCETGKGPVANLCLASLDRAHLGADEAEHILDRAGAVEMASLEKNMTWISLMIATAPMLGFLGTVWGMIQAFNDIKAANDISPAVVAGGISVALLTTAFGLVAALILQVLQNSCLYIIDNQIVKMQRSTTILLSAVKDKFRG